ncbi:MAG: polysaccharide biosynthesis tyrosine autokinase [Cytophagales bacterium]|nr:MAG: polysaccharide biosynthesis tyrosine autokinase [Cytophagales bacterium]
MKNPYYAYIGKHSNALKDKNNENFDALADFDLGKFLRILRKSLLWIVIIMIISVFLAWLFLRYTKPIHQSTSLLKLNLKTDEKNVLGLQGFNNINPDLVGEVEFIQSNLVYEAVIDKANIDVSYFAKGNILDYERFGSCPFYITYDSLQTQRIIDRPFYVHILNKNEFEISEQNFSDQNQIQKKQFGQKFILQGVSIRLHFIPERYQGKEDNQYYYFIINSRNTLINYITRNLRVRIENEPARIISISFQDHDLIKAKHIVDIIDSVYLQKTLAQKNLASKQQLKYLDEQLKNLAKKIEDHELEVEKFVLENKGKEVDGKFEKSIEQIEELLAKKMELAEQLALLDDAEVLILQDSSATDLSNLFAFLKDENLKTNINALNTLKQQREALLYSKTESTNSVIIRTQKIKEVKKVAISLLNKTRSKLYANISKLQSQISEIQEDFLGFPARERTLNRMKRLNAIDEVYYQQMLVKKAEIEIAGAGIIPEFTILSSASFSSQPIFPNKSYVYTIAFAFGGILSTLLVVVRYLLHNVISTQKELEKLTQAAILGGVPEQKNAQKQYSTLLVNKNPKSALNEALRTIRTNMDFLFPNKKNAEVVREKRVLSITSTVSGEGKTFVTVNIAGILTLSDLKVVVLDCDMRRPKVHLAFDQLNEDNHKGMSTILIGKHPYQECIRKSTLENLHYISSGPTPPNPSELLLRASFDELIVQLKEVYDVIIIDTPPVGLVTDGVVIMQKVDLPIYIVRANYSRRHFIQQIEKLRVQNNFKNLAVVINAIQRQSSYGYGYGYNYQNNYYEEEKKKTFWSFLTKK